MADQEKKQIDSGKNEEKRNDEVERGPDPFKRMDSIRRTPPKTRTSSLNREGSRDLRKEDTSKRKRAEDRTQTERKIFQMTLEKLINQIKRLDLVIRDLYKPKQEVKDTASRINLYAEQLQSKVMANWLKQVVDDSGDSDVQDTAAEAQELRREIAKLK
ncbi:hypothetical protein JTB14_020039 [Gonioctena quinquepunctata]|nr:hypothetical protein JTB14_020039 [Gonioctena quinquepunctata]